MGEMLHILKKIKDEFVSSTSVVVPSGLCKAAKMVLTFNDYEKFS